MIKDKVFFNQLDGLRFIAVILTIIAHWFPAVGWPKIPYTWNGVEIFFVISGFLITLLLIKEKEANKHTKGKIIYNFMVRRVLRLFPLYYLFILTFYLLYKVFNLYLWVPGIGPYLVTYTSNIYYNTWGPHDGVFNHTWSLAVEEQFYLLWPWVILFIKPKYFLGLFSTLILIAFLFIAFPAFFKQVLFPPIRYFTTLGAGALLAYLVYYKNNSTFYRFIYEKRLLVTVISVASYIMIILLMPRNNYYEPTREFVLMVAGFFLVFGTVTEWKGLFGKILELNPVKYVGKISYGVYLIHMPVPVVYELLQERFFPNIDLAPIVLVSIYSAVTFLTASLSYKFIESPFLRLKYLFR